MRLVSVSACILFLSACKHDPEFTTVRLQNVDMTKSKQTAVIPKVIYERMFSLSSLAPTKEGEGGSIDKPDESRPSLNLFPFDVYLVEKTKGVLKNHNYRLNFAPGGGELDLADFVSDQVEGRFQVGILPVSEGETEQWLIYLISSSRKREVEGKEIGYGCDSYLELTQHFNKVMKEEGIEAFTSKKRYVSLLAGTYFMILKTGGKVFASQLTIFDSRNKSLQCGK